MLGSSPSYRGYDTRCILQPPAIAAVKHEVLARAGDTPDDAPGIGTEGAEIAVVAVRIAEMGAAPGAGGEVEIVEEAAVGEVNGRARGSGKHVAVGLQRRALMRADGEAPLLAAQQAAAIGREGGGPADRKSVVEGRGVSVRVDLGGRGLIK